MEHIFSTTKRWGSLVAYDHIDINVPLPTTVNEIMLFLKKHAMRSADFSEIRRKDVWRIP